MAKKMATATGASVMVPNGTIFFFATAALFGHKGLYVSCTKGGTVIFKSPEHVNRFACIRARMPGWAASFVEQTLLNAFRGELRRGKLPHSDK